MFFLKRKATKDRRLGRERRRRTSRRKGGTKLRLRAGFRAAVLRSVYLRGRKDHEPLSKSEWLDTLVLSTAIEASRYKFTDKDGRPVSPRVALECISELAWDLNTSRQTKETRKYTTIERTALLIESTVDYLLARCRVFPIDRRTNPNRRN